MYFRLHKKYGFYRFRLAWLGRHIIGGCLQYPPNLEFYTQHAKEYSAYGLTVGMLGGILILYPCCGNVDYYKSTIRDPLDF